MSIEEEKRNKKNNLPLDLVHETSFSLSLSKKEKLVFLTYMKYPALTRQELGEKTEEEWGVKVSRKKIDSLLAKKGLKKELEARFEELFSGPGVYRVARVMSEQARTPGGHQERKLFFQLAGKTGNSENSSEKAPAICVEVVKKE